MSGQEIGAGRAVDALGDVTVVGVVGLGRMGGPMAANLLRAGYEVVVHDLDEARCTPVQERGATVAASAAEVARLSQLSLSVVMDDTVLRDVALGEHGILAGAVPGHLYCDLSTVSPAASDAVAAACTARGVGYLCGKVSGSVQLAEQGTLTVFASGAPEDFRRARPVLEVLGQRVLHVGGAGEAIYLKLVHSAIVAVYAALMGEALTLGQAGGVDYEQMLDVLVGGPLASTQLTLKAPLLRSRAFGDSPPSDVDTAVKDLDLVLRAAGETSVPMPLAAAVRQVMASQQAAGHGKHDIWSVIEVFEAMSSLGQPASPTSEPASPASEP